MSAGLRLLIAAGGAAGAIAALGLLARGTYRLLRGTFAVVDVIVGDPTKDRPGLVERLDRIDARIERAEHELYPNSGLSLRDSIDRIELVLTNHLQGGTK